MRFTQDLGSGSNVIRAYGNGEVRINETLVRGGVILSATQLSADAGIRSIEDWREEHLAAILALAPELVLLGTGPTQRFPPATFSARFLTAGIGFEVMNTGAACRTFNVLVAERREVVAALVV
jgi:uncharacterized protein